MTVVEAETFASNILRLVEQTRSAGSVSQPTDDA
jgi:hypothetical protein